MNQYIIDTSITATAPPPAGDPDFDDDEMLQIGDLYRIPLHVRQAAAAAIHAVTPPSFWEDRWPVALTTLPDGVVLRVDDLYLRWHARQRYMSLRIQGQEPAAYIQVDYLDFMYMHRITTDGYEQIDLRPYYLGNDTVPALV